MILQTTPRLSSSAAAVIAAVVAVTAAVAAVTVAVAAETVDVVAGIGIAEVVPPEMESPESAAAS